MTTSVYIETDVELNFYFARFGYKIDGQSYMKHIEEKTKEAFHLKMEALRKKLEVVALRLSSWMLGVTSWLGGLSSEIGLVPELVAV